MEIRIDFKGLTKYLTNSPDCVRQALFCELKERLHEKRHSCCLELRESVNCQNASGRLAILITRDPETPASVLSRLARSTELTVLEQVASHPKAAPDTLTMLSGSHHFQVRQEVVDNPNTPDHVLLKLASDEHPDVRFRVAENPNVPITILLLLLDDENPFVNARASQTIDKLREIAVQIVAA